ncbi:ATP-binding cassette domain-containing protein [Streptomyces sp. NPDC002125]
MIGAVTILFSSSNVLAQAASTGVRLDQVSFRYGEGPRVLDGITLDIPSGQRVAVVGVSGAGKTTLADVVAGTHLPEAGRVTRPDRRSGAATGPRPPAARRRRSGSRRFRAIDRGMTFA